MSTLKFLDHHIHTVFADDKWWIAVKPICEALDLGYNYYLKRIKSDPILGQLWCKHTTVGADNATRLMVCLPEDWIYGWIFSLNSKNPSFIKYKKDCYLILKKHFEGERHRRMKLGRIQTIEEIERQNLEVVLMQIPEYVRKKELDGSLKSRAAQIRESFKKEATRQAELFN